MSGQKPSDKFGVRREEDGSLLMEFYRPSGDLVSRVTFDVEAAEEFIQALIDTAPEPERYVLWPNGRIDAIRGDQ